MSGTGERTTDLARDHDELLVMHAAVLAEANRYRVLFGFAPTALVVTDDNLVVREANEAAARLFEVEPRFLLGKPLTVYVDLSSRRLLRTWTTGLSRLPGPADATLRMRRRSGVAFDAAVRVARGPETLLWSIVDRTDDAQAEARLWELNRELAGRVTEQAAELEALVAQLPVGVIVVAADGGVAWANDRAEEILGPGLESDDVRDEHGVAIPEEQRPRARALAGETVRDLRVRLARPGGVEVVVDVTAVPVTSAGGGAVIVVNDATERDRIERADAEFVQNAAHQLRNPVAAIAASTAALQAGASTDEHERERFLAHIDRESARMTRVVEALLALANLQHGTFSFAPQVFPLDELVADAVAAVAPPAGVVVDVRIEPDTAVVADHELLVQAIGNVLGNAIEHTNARVEVRGRLDAGTVVLDVVDFGAGVDAESGERVFERFYHRSRNGRQGSGLGLPIARAAAVATGSTLELLAPRAGEGATFRFRIPGARRR